MAPRLVSILLLGLGAWAVPQPAGAGAIAFCQGEMATIVGTDAAENIDGTAGRDVIVGGLGGDVIFAAGGGDLICGGDGDDLIFGGGGNDTTSWAPGDDNDTIEGQDGTDRLLVGANAATETMQVFANGGRVTFTRDIASVVHDLDGVERIDVLAREAADTLIVTTTGLEGTDLTDVRLALEGGTGAGDGSADAVRFFGSSVEDEAEVSQVGGATRVTTHGVRTTITGAEAVNDTIQYDAGTGVDTTRLVGSDAPDRLQVVSGGFPKVSAGFPVVLIDTNQVVVDGRGGDDVIEGSGLDETLLGGSGNDRILSGPGINVVKGGSGNDLLVGGSGNEAFVGGSGVDKVSFATSTVAVSADLAAGTATGPGSDSLAQVEVLIGSALGDLLFGSSAADLLIGGLGGDSLTGRGGADRLDAGGGNDFLSGGGGEDRCAGGANQDTADSCEHKSGIP